MADRLGRNSLVAVRHAILYLLVHNAYCIELSGESMRKQKAEPPLVTGAETAKLIIRERTRHPRIDGATLSRH